MSASTPKFTPMTVGEYLRTELDSPIKREFVGGFVYPLHGEMKAQAGASQDHGRICLNVTLKLAGVALAQGCRYHTAEMKLLVDGLPSFYSLDVMVTCGEKLDDYYEKNPYLLVEVLSDRTAHNDRHAKLQAYQTIPTLQTYLIVSQSERSVIAYQRTPEGWQMKQYEGEGEIPLSCPPVTPSLDDLYAGQTLS